MKEEELQVNKGIKLYNIEKFQSKTDAQIHQNSTLLVIEEDKEIKNLLDSTLI